MDEYAERGIEVQVDVPRPVEELVTLIRQRQTLDFCRSNLNSEITMQRIIGRIERWLEKPESMLILPNQRTKQFRVRKAKNPEYIIIDDLRELPEREGDVRPSYWIRLWWLLLSDFNIVQYTGWYSHIYDKIRASLYQAIHYTAASPNARGTRQGNQFAISMGEPDVWYIEDRVMQKTLFLWQMQATDREFSIMQWYILENSIYEYNRKQFIHITGPCAEGLSRNNQLVTDQPLTPPDETTGRRNTKRNPKKVPVKIEPVEQEKPVGEDAVKSERKEGGKPRRVPLPRLIIPPRSRDSIEAWSRTKSRRDSDEFSDLPSLIQVSSSGVSDDDDDDDPNVTRTLSEASLDEEMKDASEWIQYPAEQSPELSSSTRYPDPPPLAFSVLASLKRP
ncbi:hypothetical protein FRC01_009694 [Tulasnella sp. 417]|nr:hypothetical protein FRC01_009694 [Tulasnella sp. 417]